MSALADIRYRHERETTPRSEDVSFLLAALAEAEQASESWKSEAAAILATAQGYESERNEARELLAAAHRKTDTLREAVLSWTYDHADDGPCSCSLCAALAAAVPVVVADARLSEREGQPLLNAARRLVAATDNAERNAALGDLVNAIGVADSPQAEQDQGVDTLDG